MTWYRVRSQAARNIAGTSINSGSGQLYAVTDPTGTTPLNVRHVDAGTAMSAVLVTDWLTEECEVEDHYEMYWKSGSLPPVYLFSAEGMHAAAVAAEAAAVAAQGSAAASATSAETAANLVGAPADAAMAAAAGNPASLFRAEMAEFTPVTVRGTYAARPAASSVAPGSMYFPTDVPEQYRSNGTTWEVVGSGGNEIGYAEITSNFSTTSTTNVDVTGMSFTFVVGERPIKLRFDGVLGNGTAAVATFASILLDGTQVASCGGPEAAAGGFRGTARTRRIAGLVPGSTHTAKMQLRTATTGSAIMYGGATNVAALTVETA